MPELRDVSTDQQDQGLAENLVIDRDTASRLGITASAIDQVALRCLWPARSLHHVHRPEPILRGHGGRPAIPAESRLAQRHLHQGEQVHGRRRICARPGHDNRIGAAATTTWRRPQAAAAAARARCAASFVTAGGQLVTSSTASGGSRPGHRASCVAATIGNSRSNDESQTRRRFSRALLPARVLRHRHPPQAAWRRRPCPAAPAPHRRSHGAALGHCTL